MKGKDYYLTEYVDSGGVYCPTESEMPDDLDIIDGEKIKVTYTLL